MAFFLALLMATGLVEFIGSQIGTAGDATHELTKLLDADAATYFDVAGTANGVWAGLDLGSAATVRRVKFQPRRGDAGAATKIQFEDRVFGGKVQASSSSTFAADVNDALTLNSVGPPSYRNGVWNELALTSTFSKQYIRWLSPNGGHGDLAELRFIGDAGPSSAKPVQPVITPSVGWHSTSAQSVTIASATTSAAIYYTLDGTAPDNTKTLYTGPITINSTVTLKAAAYDNTLGTPLSDATTAFFKNYSFKPNEDERDDKLDLIEAHSGGYLKGARAVPLSVNGYFWKYGGNANRYNVVEGFSDGLGVDGIWAYKSTDHVNWTIVGNILDNAASSYTLRPHAFETTPGNFVLYAKTWNAERLAIATATNPAGPWTWGATAYDPGGGVDDFNITKFSNGNLYLVWCTSSNGSIKIQQLASDGLTVTGSPTTVDTATHREAPCLMEDHEGNAVLIYSAQAYYDSTVTFQGGVKFAATPLGSWSDSSSTSFATDPVGTSYNIQPMDIIAINGGWMLIGDKWVHANITDSRYACLPVDHWIATPTVWELSRLAIPANDLSNNLAAFYGCTELTAGANLVDKVGGLTLTAAGNMNVHGARIRSRDFNINQAKRADHATFRVNGTSFFIAGWALLNSIGTFPTLVAKWDTGASHLDYVLYCNSSGKLVLELSANGTSSAVTVTGATTVPVGSFFLFTYWYDIALNKAGLALNGTQDAESTYSSGVAATAAEFCLGKLPDASNRWAGLMTHVGLWKASKPTAAQLAALYNNGVPLPFEYFDDGIGSGHFGTVFAGAVR